jgi:probable rRNA maturation factor
LNVFVANEQTIRVDELRLRSLASHTLTAEQMDEEAELSILLVGADHIKRLNKRFAGDEYATDVLAFPMMDDDENDTLLGDVVICPEVARTNAEKLGHDLTEELDTLVVHGTLHLLGYDHQGTHDKHVMDERLREIVQSFEPSNA